MDPRCELVQTVYPLIYHVDPGPKMGHGKFLNGCLLRSGNCLLGQHVLILLCFYPWCEKLWHFFYFQEILRFYFKKSRKCCYFILDTCKTSLNNMLLLSLAMKNILVSHFRWTESWISGIQLPMLSPRAYLQCMEVTWCVSVLLKCAEAHQYFTIL